MGEGYLIFCHFVHNVNFSGKLEKFSKILSSQNGSVKGTRDSSRSEIFIDCLLARG